MEWLSTVLSPSVHKDLSAVSLADVEQMLVRNLGMAPLIIPYLRRLRYREIIDQLCPYEGVITHGQVAEILLINRLMAPRPIYEVSDWAKWSGVAEFLGINPEYLNDDRIGRTLDDLYPIVRDIQSKVTLGAIGEFEIECDLLHYDLTSVYFEGEYNESEIIEFGYSRDKKPECKQVVLGVNTSSDGEVVVGGDVHPGNTADVKTVVKNMKRLQSCIDKTRLVVSGDTIMWSADNMWEVIEAGGIFVGPHKREGIVLELLEETPDEAYQELDFRMPPAGRRKDYRTYRCALRSFDLEKTYRDGHKERGKVLCALLYDGLNGCKEGKIREERIRKFEEAIDRIRSKLNSGRYKRKEYVEERLKAIEKREGNVSNFVVLTLKERKDGRLSLWYGRNKNAIKRAAFLDGKWVLVTNATVDAGANREEEEKNLMEWMIKSYKGHGRIEGRMKNIKKDIRIRPIFLSKDERIVSLCYLTLEALRVFTLIERDCIRKLGGIGPKKATFTNLMNVMRPVSLVIFKLKDGRRAYRMGDLSLLQEKIAKRLGMSNINQLLEAYRALPP